MFGLLCHLCMSETDHSVAVCLLCNYSLGHLLRLYVDACLDDASVKYTHLPMLRNDRPHHLLLNSSD